MTEGHNRQSAEIIPFPAGRSRSAGLTALEAEAAKYRAAVDTTGWYHDEAIEEEVDHTCEKAWRF